MEKCGCRSVIGDRAPSSLTLRWREPDSNHRSRRERRASGNRQRIEDVIAKFQRGNPRPVVRFK